jgi:hypothetical protein
MGCITTGPPIHGIRVNTYGNQSSASASVQYCPTASRPPNMAHLSITMIHIKRLKVMSRRIPLDGAVALDSGHRFIGWA